MKAQSVGSYRLRFWYLKMIIREFLRQTGRMQRWQLLPAP